jgi:hypothetical protein
MIQCVADAPETPRDRLRRLVVERRLDRQLSVSKARKIAAIARGTWIALESGERETEAYNFAGIERALRWAPGSIDAILKGGDPTPLPVDEVAPAPPEPERPTSDWEQRLVKVREVAANPDRSPGLRAWARRQITQIEEEIEAILEAAEAEEEAARREAG